MSHGPYNQTTGPDQGKKKRLRSLKNILYLILTIFSFAIINPTSGQEQEPIHLEEVAWSPDGSLIAVAGGNTAGCNLTPDPSATIFLLDAITGHVQQRLPGSLCDVRYLSWNPDGSRLVSADFDSTFRIWDPLTGQQVAESEPNRSRTDVVWSPDNTKIANIWGDHFIVELLGCVRKLS